MSGCVQYGNLHITLGPDVRTPTERVETKWCFNCRKHLDHRLVILSDSEPSYYEPLAVWECPCCGKDFTLFPGTEYVD